MRKIVILLMCVFFLTSCSNEDNLIIDEPIIDENNTDTYMFESIEYYYENVDDLKISTYKDATDTQINGGETTIEVKIQPNLIYNTSQFFPDEKPNVNLEIDDSLKISVPYAYSADSFSSNTGLWFSIWGLGKWKYSEEKEELPYVDNVGTSYATLPPHTQIQITYEYTRYNITALYEATFVGKELGKKIKVSGKWKGECHSYAGSSTIMSQLKN